MRCSIFLLIWIWSLVFDTSIIWSILILKMQRTSISFKSWYGALVGAGGSWLGFGILIFIWIWSVVFYTLMIQILALYLNFEGAKIIHVLKVLIWDFGECWRFLTGVLHLDPDLNMVTVLWYTHDPNFGSLSWVWRCKEHQCPLSPHLGLWRVLEVPDWGLASLSWLEYGDLGLIDL